MQEVRNEIDKKIEASNFNATLDGWLQKGDQLDKRLLCLRLGFGKKLEQCYKPDENFEQTLRESVEANNTREVALMMLAEEDEMENTMTIEDENINPGVKANKISIIEEDHLPSSSLAASTKSSCSSMESSCSSMKSTDSGKENYAASLKAAIMIKGPSVNKKESGKTGRGSKLTALQEIFVKDQLQTVVDAKVNENDAKWKQRFDENNAAWNERFERMESHYVAMEEMLNQQKKRKPQVSTEKGKNAKKKKNLNK